MACHIAAAPGGSSMLMAWGPTNASAASAASTADIPTAAHLLALLLPLLIGGVAALLLPFRPSILLLGLMALRFRAQEFLQVSKFVEQSARLDETLHLLFMAELTETGVKGANLVSGNSGLEEAKDLLVSYARNLDWLEVTVIPLLEVRDLSGGSQRFINVWYLHLDLSVFYHPGQLKIISSGFRPSQLDELARPFHHALKVGDRQFK